MKIQGSGEFARRRWPARRKVRVALLLSLIGIAILLIAARIDKPQRKETDSSQGAEKSANRKSSSLQEGRVSENGPVMLEIESAGNQPGLRFTPKFTASADWDIKWSYDCSGQSPHNAFVVSLIDAEGHPVPDAPRVSKVGAKESGVQRYHQHGTYFLGISSQCPWHVSTVKAK